MALYHHASIGNLDVPKLIMDLDRQRRSALTKSQDFSGPPVVSTRVSTASISHTPARTPTTTLPDRAICGYCNRSDALPITCLACDLVRYCNEEHQALHHPKHGPLCHYLQQCLAKVQSISRLCRPTTLEYALETSTINAIWAADNMRMREYSQARLDVVKAILAITPQTREVVQVAWDYLDESVHHARHSSFLGLEELRELCPGLLIQLGDDVRAFAVIKTRYERLGYGLEDRADFEERCDPECLFWEMGYKMIPHPDLVALVLIKVRLLVNLQRIHDIRPRLLAGLPREVVSQIEAHEPWGPFLPACRRFKWLKDDAAVAEALDSAITSVQKQIGELGKAISWHSKWTWSMILDADKFFAALPGDQRRQHVLRLFAYNAWKQSVGALEELERMAGEGVLGKRVWAENGIMSFSVGGPPIGGRAIERQLSNEGMQNFKGPEYFLNFMTEHEERVLLGTQG